MWAALRYIAESSKKGDAGPARLLLMDEPELCLHPNAIREACSTLYQLPETKKWQVMVTTHSPAFIDLSRDNTTVVRVQRDQQNVIHGTTVFRPNKTKLDPDEKQELKLLNIYDPHVAEFFFGGRTILVEGDTEYTAFKYIIFNDPQKEIFKDVHVVRARGKVTVGLLAKILNQFNARFAVLHDCDTPTVRTRKGNTMKNPAWTNNEKILAGVGKTYDKERIRLVVSMTNFESAMFGEEVDVDKPYNAFETMKAGGAAYDRVKQLLVALLDFEKPLPNECLQWDDFTKLEAEFQKRFPPAA
jgi:putative ATP-dependent endonuclease of OLD family